jgi:hypothetical protein
MSHVPHFFFIIIFKETKFKKVGLKSLLYVVVGGILVEPTKSGPLRDD